MLGRSSAELTGHFFILGVADMRSRVVLTKREQNALTIQLVRVVIVKTIHRRQPLIQPQSKALSISKR